MVALRKESVDRNYRCGCARYSRYVALRKESVDRNFDAVQIVIIKMESLSARRAWIEIMRRDFKRLGLLGVALRKESVDRNLIFLFRLMLSVRRSPQGERG